MAIGASPESVRKRRNRWIWISAALALVAIALLVWALSFEQDRTTAQDHLDSTQAELDSANQEIDALQSAEPQEDSNAGLAVVTAGALAAVKSTIDDLEEQLGVTQGDLEAAEQDLLAANDQASRAAESKAAIAAECAQAYIAGFGLLFEGDDVDEQAEAVREQLSGVTDQCEAAFGDV